MYIDCKLLTYTFPNSAVPYCEQFYNKIVLVVWILCKSSRKVGCVLLMDGGN